MIYELTVSFDKNIHTWHKYKCKKNAYFETNIKHYETQVIACEVGPRGGLTDDNVKWLTDMHKDM